MPTSADRRLVWGAAIAVLLAASAARAADPGAALAEACSGCHGEGGNSTTAAIPSLAGHPAPYLSTQLILFRKNQRQSEIMAPLAKSLTDDEIEALAGHFAGLARRQSGPLPAAAPDGPAIAQANHCGSCHLPSFHGREQIPRLAAQRQDYLVKAMRDYKTGARSGVDGMMTGILRPVPDADIDTLAAYLASLP